MVLFLSASPLARRYEKEMKRHPERSEGLAVFLHPVKRSGTPTRPRPTRLCCWLQTVNCKL
jgi:hypothetical protein